MTLEQALAQSCPHCVYPPQDCVICNDLDTVWASCFICGDKKTHAWGWFVDGRCLRCQKRI